MPVSIYRRLQTKFNPTQPNIPTHQRSGLTTQIWKRYGATAHHAAGHHVGHHVGKAQEGPAAINPRNNPGKGNPGKGNPGKGPAQRRIM